MKKHRKKAYRLIRHIPKPTQIEISENLRFKLIGFKTLMFKAEERTEAEMIEYAKNHPVKNRWKFYGVLPINITVSQTNNY